MLGLTPLGTFHTAVSLIAVGAGLVTLVVLAIAWAAGRAQLFGRTSPYVETVGYSLTFFFHMIPGITETTTRLPAGAPLLPNADAPALQVASAVLFVVFLIGATLQVRRLRARLATAAPTDRVPGKPA